MTSKNTMTEKFEVLSDRQHVLMRPTIMIGSVTPEPIKLYLSGSYCDATVTPGLLCIAREVIDNSVDEYVRSNGAAATKISITMNPDSLEVIDNGRGIPIEKYIDAEQGVEGWRPELAWTHLRAGSNFNDNRASVGQNGVGSSVANILSKKFIGETWDGTQVCTVTCSNNMDVIETSVHRKKRATGTRVYIEPDFQRFGVKCFTEDHIKVSKERILALASIFPEITFTFNGERITSKKPKDYLDMYNKKYVLQDGENYYFALMPTETEEYYCNSFIGGLWIRNGGAHEQYIMKELCQSLKESIKKKFKLEMMPAEIKRGLMLVFNARYFKNLKFDSQTKERLTNSEADVKAFLGSVDFDKLAKQIVNTPEIIDPIVEAKLAKQIAAEKRALTLAQKKMAKKYVEKHLAAKSKNIKEKTLFLCEGDSACSSAIRVRNVNTQGFFPLRGKPKNTFGLKDSEIVANAEFENIMSILGLRFNMTSQEIDNDLSYGHIGILADGDLDGTHIATLLINFFSKWPRLFDDKRVYIVTSPMYIFTKNKGKKNEERFYFYSKDEYEEAVASGKYKGYNLRYIKGLGSLTPHEFRDVLNTPNRWLSIDIDDMKCLEIMFGDDVQSRRAIMEI